MESLTFRLAVNDRVIDSHDNFFKSPEEAAKGKLHFVHKKGDVWSIVRIERKTIFTFSGGKDVQ